MLIQQMQTDVPSILIYDRSKNVHFSGNLNVGLMWEIESDPDAILLFYGIIFNVCVTSVTLNQTFTERWITILLYFNAVENITVYNRALRDNKGGLCGES